MTRLARAMEKEKEKQNERHHAKTLICALNLLSRDLPLPPHILNSVSSIYRNHVTFSFSLFLSPFVSRRFRLISRQASPFLLSFALACFVPMCVCDLNFVHSLASSQLYSMCKVLISFSVPSCVQRHFVLQFPYPCTSGVVCF